MSSSSAVEPASVRAAWAAAAVASCLCLLVLSLPQPAGTQQAAGHAVGSDAGSTLASAAARLQQRNWTWSLEHGTPAEQRRRLRLHNRRLRAAEATALQATRQGVKRKHDGIADDAALLPAQRGSPPRGGTGEDSIFVSIASYRDDQCAPTVYDMYERALKPERVFVGIVQQNYVHDNNCVPPEFLAEECQLRHFCPTDNIQSRWIAPRYARGPTYGRYVGQLMYRGEKYYMMIDSHNRFVTHWDDVVVRMHKSLPNPQKGVLSHYPSGWHNEGHSRERQTNEPLDNRKTTSFLCTAKFAGGLGYIRLDGFVVPVGERPRPQPWAAAGFLFADAALLREVPFDPHLHYVFDGEEVLFSVRMWTHGYDIFSPNENILYHYYYRPGAPKFWATAPEGHMKLQSAAQRRVQWLLRSCHRGTATRMVPENTTEAGVVIEASKYGLGTVRSLDAWYAYAGVDRFNYTVEKKFCIY